VEDATQGKYSDDLHPGDTFKGSLNWHSRRLESHCLISTLHPLELSSQSQPRKAKPSDIGWKGARPSLITHSREMMKPGQSVILPPVFAQSSTNSSIQHLMLRLPSALVEAALSR